MATPITDKQFVARFHAAALATERSHGVPAWFTLAQHLTEQGRNLTPPGNMCFGIKADPSWKGKRQLLRTWEVHDKPTGYKYPEILSVTAYGAGKWKYVVRDWFRAYDSLEASYADHAAFLKRQPRYKKAFQYPHDPVAFAKEIAAAGYATDPDYFAKLKQNIAQLKKWEPSAQPQPAPPVASSSPASPPTSSPGKSGGDSKARAELAPISQPGAGK